ncbi:hypothetical protein JKY79_00380 [Candidatus Babeliales bacterium]|nr:hypothetical protein [Candidatus Babeliales bacterium]
MKNVHVSKFICLTVSLFILSYALQAASTRYRTPRAMPNYSPYSRVGRASRASIARQVASQTVPLNTTSTQASYNAPNTGSRWTRGKTVNKRIHQKTMSLIHTKRTIIQRSTQKLNNLLENIKKQTAALFYLVDQTGNPVSLTNITTAIGSKSIQVPSLSNLTEEQQGILNGTSVTVEENVKRWVETYLDNVKRTRSKSLTGPSLIMFGQYWERTNPRYTSALTKIFHTISLPKNTSQKLGFVSVDGTPITLLFFDDPFPPHTVPGSARSPFRDLLDTFITRYGL